MVEWEWTRREVGPEEVLDAARTIAPKDTRVTIDFTSHWVDPGRYLGWATGALRRGGEDGWDAAAGWAKRAVGRRLDGILVHNHLGRFLGKNYKAKGELLAALNVPGLAPVRDLVIDPRNDIEHEYAAATEGNARRAVEVAELFLMATAGEAAMPAIASLGWNVNSRRETSTKPGQEYDRREFGLAHHHTPMLLLDVYAPDPEVLVVYPKDEAVSVCRLATFSAEQLLELNGRLRHPPDPARNGGWPFDRAMMTFLRMELRL